MASTKQMQQRAKERNKMMKFIDILRAEMDKLNAVQDALVPHLNINLIGYEKGNYWNRQWADDYNKTDLGNCIQQTEDEEGIENYEIEYKGQAVGWFNLVDQSTIKPSGQRETRRELAAIYIVPEHRGLGIATMAYIHAMHELGCNLIELTYERALGRLHYWQALGFRNVLSRFGQNGSRKALAMLITGNDAGLPLNKENINHIRKKCETMDWDAEAKKIGMPIDRIA
jgi:GNAT superfamily N-acetyltransferase